MVIVAAAELGGCGKGGVDFTKELNPFVFTVKQHVENIYCGGRVVECHCYIVAVVTVLNTGGSRDCLGYDAATAQLAFLLVVSCHIQQCMPEGPRTSQQIHYHEVTSITPGRWCQMQPSISYSYSPRADEFADVGAPR